MDPLSRCFEMTLESGDQLAGPKELEVLSVWYAGISESRDWNE